MKLSLLSIPLAVLVPFVEANLRHRQHARVLRRAQPTPGVTNVAAAWYAGWASAKLPPNDISFSEYTHLTYSFAVTTPDVNVLSLEDSDEPNLPVFVKACHDHNVNALLSIGGWTGSRYFSTNVGSADNRTAFVKTVTQLVTKYNLDGVDFDWEYPNHQGVGCNIVNSNDTPNFLLFLNQLRADPVGQKLIITAATSNKPFAGVDGNPSASVADFSKVLSYVAIMNYDIWGSWSPSVGPNAPLDDSCAAAANQQGSATSAVASWIAAGFPANQIVLGVPSYGHSFHVAQSDAFAAGSQTTLAPYPNFDATQQPTGDSGDAPSVDVCGVQNGVTGYFHFWGLIEAGFLGQDGKPASGMVYRYDTCSQTPYVYNPNTQVMVSYDDADSFAAKGKFIKDKGLLGWAMWEASGDYDDILVDSISSAVGASSPQQCRRR
jgi:chitinase